MRTQLTIGPMPNDDPSVIATVLQATDVSLVEFIHPVFSTMVLFKELDPRTGEVVRTDWSGEDDGTVMLPAEYVIDVEYIDENSL